MSSQLHCITQNLGHIFHIFQTEHIIRHTIKGSIPVYLVRRVRKNYINLPFYIFAHAKLVSTQQISEFELVYGPQRHLLLNEVLHYTLPTFKQDQRTDLLECMQKTFPVMYLAHALEAVSSWDHVILFSFSLVSAHIVPSFPDQIMFHMSLVYDNLAK